MANKHQKLKIQLTDDLGNTQTIFCNDAANIILNNNIRRWFVPCDICDNYILGRHINLTSEKFPTMYCNNCSNIVNKHL